MIEFTEGDGAITFAVRVAPRASRNAIKGEYDGALKVRLTAPPLDGRANDALRRLLADRLNVPISAVKIVSGKKATQSALPLPALRARKWPRWPEQRATGDTGCDTAESESRPLTVAGVGR